MMELTHLDTALKNGATLHGFRSGGGLRVFRVNSADDENIGYGEHPAALDALAHVNLWLEQEPKPTYKEFYGGKFPHYLTGSTHSSDALDEWMKQGQTVDAHCTPEGVVVLLHGYTHADLPQSVKDAADAAGGPVEWENRGYKFEVTPIRFANNDPGHSVKTVFVPEGKRQVDATFYKVVKTGVGATFLEAVDAAFAAEEQEANG
jgi:hypothetical protein